MHIINGNAVRGRLSKTYLTRKFIAQNIFDMKYSRFTVLQHRNALVLVQSADSRQSVYTKIAK